MTAYHLIEVIVLLILAILELRRGYKILFRNEVAYYTGLRFLYWFLDSIGLQKVSNFSRKKVERKKDQMFSGVLGLIVGTFILITILIVWLATYLPILAILS